MDLANSGAHIGFSYIFKSALFPYLFSDYKKVFKTHEEKEKRGKEEKKLLLIEYWKGARGYGARAIVIY